MKGMVHFPEWCSWQWGHLLHQLEVIGSKRRASFPSPHHYSPDKGGHMVPALPLLCPQWWFIHARAHRVGLTLSQRWRERPVLLSAVAGEGLVQIPYQLQVLRVSGGWHLSLTNTPPWLRTGVLPPFPFSRLQGQLVYALMTRVSSMYCFVLRWGVGAYLLGASANEGWGQLCTVLSSEP